MVAIDGKALCGSRESGKKTLVHMVSAWAEGNGLVLAQRKVDEKSNEITAIPKLLDALELAGTVVTIDAMGCQRSIADKIVRKKADYILAVKENQGSLLEEIKDSFRQLGADAVTDVALLRIEAGRLPALHLGSSRSVSVGDAVIAIAGATRALFEAGAAKPARETSDARERAVSRSGVAPSASS